GDPGFVLWRVDFAFLGFTHDLGFPGFETILNFCLKSGVHFRPFKHPGLVNSFHSCRRRHFARPGLPVEPWPIRRWGF
ncbi:hypothetical protein, partial [Polaromonas sp.]|uniref:hypothetical protein n=1 Tax=Polaromonas sp. TaxID=1869339 RepID=UPI003BB4DF6B